MASSRIKGITVEIGGDTVGLQNALRDVNNRTKEVQSELKDVERLLKFDPNNVELLAQRQQLLTQAIQSSTDKLNQLRQAEAQVQAQFERGEISQEQYRGFRRELQQTEQQMAGFQQALQDMQTEQEQVGQRTRQMSALFEATGTSVEDYANVIGQRLVRAIQNGTATSRDLEYAFQRIGRQAIGTNGDIERLRTTLASVDSGNSIQNIRRDLQQLQSEAEDAAESVEGIGIELENVAGALVAGGGIAGAVEEALDMSSINTKIDITFDVPEESKQNVKEAVRGIISYGVDGEEALEGVRRQWALNKDASDAVNDSIARGAAAIAKNFAGVDFIELIQETNEIAAALKISNEEALALTNSLLKAGFPPEQLDTIAEYGQQMKDIGFSTAEIQAIFEAGIDTKTWNIDNLNDGVKEARLQMATFGTEIPKALEPVLKNAGLGKKKFQEWGQAVAEGGEKGSKAMAEAVTYLEKMEEGTAKNDLATAMFATKWEDQGQNMISVFQGIGEASDKTTENLNGLYATMGKTNADPMVELQHAINNVKMAAEPLLQVIADVVSKIANWIAENPKLAATITAIATTMGVLIGAILAIAPVVTAIVTSMGTLGLTFSAIAGPIGITVAAITGLVAAGVLLYQNWDTIGKTASTVFNSVKDTIANALTAVQESLSTVGSSISNFAGPIIEKLGSAFQNLGATIMGILNGDFAQLGEFFKMLLPSLIGLMVGGLPGLIISASRFLPAIAEGMESNKGVLIESINGVVASIIEFLEVGLPQLVGAGLTIVLNLIEGIVGALPGVVEAGVSLIQSLIEGIGTVLPAIITLALEVVTSLVTTIAEALPQVIDAGIGILNAVISGIISVLPLLIGAAVLLITSLVTTLVENLPKILSAGMEILKALIEGIVKILPSLIKTAINLIVTIIKTLAENLPKIINAGVQVLEALIKGIIKILPTLIKTAINLVIQIAKAIIDNLPTILKAGKDILLALIDGIISIVTTLLSAIAKDVVNPLLKKFEDIDLKQIGKDIIQGLINGIGEMVNDVKEKATSVAEAVTGTLRKILDIRSPSRVTTKLGEYTGQGFADGVSNKQKEVEKASKQTAAAAQKGFNDGMSKLSLNFKAGKIDISSYIKALEKMKEQYKTVPNAVSKVDAQIADLRKKHTKQLFDIDKKYYADKVKFENISLDEQLQVLEKLAAGYKQNSEERMYFEDQLKNKKLEINKEIERINEDYLGKVKTLNQKLIDEEAKLNAEYQKALDDRTKTLYSFAGIFDEVVAKDVSGDVLLSNLQSQVVAFEEWQKNISELASKGINEGLLAELQEMGPKAGAEIAALNTLTDDQLAQYVLLWQQKNQLAKEQSLSELEGLKMDTEKKINELRMKTAEQLRVYQTEWRNAMLGVKGKVKVELQEMPGIGQYAVSGLISGLLSKKAELESVAQELANVVTETFQSALDIHSPSRVFRGFGININEGLIQGIKESASKLNSAMNNVYGSIASSAGKMMQSGNAAGGSNQKAVGNTTNIENNYYMTFHSPKALDPYETSRLNRNALRELALQV